MRKPGSNLGRIIVIGGGIQGLSIAFNLARLGVRQVRVFDAGYFQGGASGRNGTLIRGGFGSLEWTRFFAHSNRLWRDLSHTLGENVMFAPRGYIILAHSQSMMENLTRMVDLHRAQGVKSEPLTPAKLAALEPAIDVSKLAGAIYLPEGGAAPHHAAMQAYLAACRRAGIVVEYQRPVTAIEKTNGRVSGIRVGDEHFPADTLVIAAGAYAPAVGKLAGVEMPGFPLRIEAMALEPVRPMLRAALALPERLCYLHQTTRGEIVGGAEVAEKPQQTLTSDLPAMAATARAYAEILPAVGHLRILRQWAGMLHATPDWAPLLGPHPEIANLWLSAGWSYGYAGAPAAGDLLAKAIVEEQIGPEIAPFAIDRFTQGRAVADSSLVLAPIR
jgi:sarcosine oxidase, subunit beta